MLCVGVYGVIIICASVVFVFVFGTFLGHFQLLDCVLESVFVLSVKYCILLFMRMFLFLFAFTSSLGDVGLLILCVGQRMCVECTVCMMCCYQCIFFCFVCVLTRSLAIFSF